MKTCPFCWADNDDSLSVCESCRKELKSHANDAPRGAMPARSTRAPKLTSEQYEVLAKAQAETQKRRLTEEVIADCAKRGLKRMRWGGGGGILVALLFLKTSGQVAGDRLTWFCLPTLLLPYLVLGIGLGECTLIKLGKISPGQAFSLFNFEKYGSLFWFCVGVGILNAGAVIALLLVGPIGAGVFLFVAACAIGAWSKV